VKLRDQIITAATGITGAAIAKQAGISRTCVTDFRSNKRECSLKTIEKIADALGYDVVLVKRSKEITG
jgi:DNA-binding phage protein